MLQTKPLFRRFTWAVGVGLVLASAGPGLAAAQDVQNSAAPSTSERVESTASMTVVRDAETGQLRAPTAAELETLNQASLRSRSMLRSAPAMTMQKFHSGGARGARLTDEFMSAAVAVRQVDGSLAHQCFDSHDHAEAVARTATGPASRTVTE